MTDKLLLSALTLLIYGVIEIPSQNETNTLRYIQYAPQIRAEVPTDEERNAHNVKCLNESEVIAAAPEENNDCFYYALQRTLGVTLEEEVTFPGRLFSIFVEDYFEQTDNPEPNDLVIYTHNENELQMSHFAIVIENDSVESLWAQKVRRYKLWNIPTYLGNAAWFYTLKKEYKSTQGKAKAIAEIYECLALQKKLLTELQQEKPTALVKRLKKIAPQLFQK